MIDRDLDHSRRALMPVKSLDRVVVPKESVATTEGILHIVKNTRRPRHKIRVVVDEDTGDLLNVQAVCETPRRERLEVTTGNEQQ